MMKFETGNKIEHADLIEACRMKDRQAQEKIYDLYCHAMFNTSYRIVNNTAEAEDIMQESFIEAFEKLHFFRGEGSFGSWLKKIVINNSINHIRKQKPTTSLDSTETELPDNAEEDKTYSENLFCRLEEIRSAMKKLPESYRMVLSLNLLEGYDHEEISGILNTTYGNVRTRFSRAKQKLLSIIMNEREKQ
jgi:RNA polymerase sigma-70 factor (ECF subfamily)